MLIERPKTFLYIFGEFVEEIYAKMFLARITSGNEAQLKRRPVQRLVRLCLFSHPSSDESTASVSFRMLL
jgi:hypothetical protein